jgi:hypothetical protein
MTQNASAKEALFEAVRHLLRHWSKGELSDLGPLTELRLYMRLVVQSDQVSPEPTAIARQLVEQALTRLRARYEPAVDLLRQRYLEGVSTREMALRLNTAESNYFKLQNEALHQLTDFILELEQEARSQYQLAIKARLEMSPDQPLFGVDQARQQVRAVVEQAEQPWLVAVDGIGGIGKTSLANALVQEMVQTGRFYDIAWVSARQQDFTPGTGLQPVTSPSRPALDVDTLTDNLLEQLDDNPPLTASLQEKIVALTKLLKKYPHLVVVDNLETVIDYQTLLPLLRKLANPSKFLLTSRHSLRAYSDVFCLSLGELTQADAFAFLGHEADVRGLPVLADASQVQLEDIYDVVGGNPLALKLVIGQLCVLPLSQVLEDLRQARGKSPDELYTHIYWQAWHALAPPSQQVLLIMPLAQDGALAQLVTLSELEMDEMNQALAQLATLSLVEVRGDIEQRRYRIHRLTETFLLNEVVKWQSSL